MTCEPENDLDIGPVPAVSEVMGEETPRVVVVLIWEEDAHTLVTYGVCVVVVAPDDTEVERTSRRHDGDVWEWPAAVVVGEGVDRLQKEGVALDRAHSIVRDAGGDGAANPGRVSQEGIEAAVASLLILVYARKHRI